ncbi:phosphatidylinositol kinase, putative [Bodo saltans]|uniref:1-phosphatidylinositol 4-kinase n=1 Tax=Bodo saltans TaxID=75058 RepID=A0A0S4KN22_BODSA|nr:phosphatidylinositol kinase, putative [Bodo saltans]|eukprot:CUI15037.1 phosphatidylinositol kinase, putative [Bodo saltans]
MGNDIVLKTTVPAWLQSSPFFRLANVLHADIVSRYPNSQLLSSHATASLQRKPQSFLSAQQQQGGSSSPHQTSGGVNSRASPQRSNAGGAAAAQQQSVAAAASLDVLLEPRVNAFLHYAVPTAVAHGSKSAPPTPMSSVWSAPVELKEITFKTAPSIASVFHFLALCKASSLPPHATRALFVEGASLFVALMRAVNSQKIAFRAGVDEVGFLQFVVSSMVQLRGGNECSGADGANYCGDVGFASVDKKLVDDALAHTFPLVVIAASAGSVLPPNPANHNQRATGTQSWSAAQRNIVSAVTRGLHSAAAALLDSEDVLECHHRHSAATSTTTAVTCTACLHISQAATKGRRGVALPITPSLLAELITCAENIIEGCPHVVGGGQDDDDDPAIPLQTVNSVTARDSTTGTNSSDGGNNDRDIASDLSPPALDGAVGDDVTAVAADSEEFTLWSIQTLTNLMTTFSVVVLAESINSQQYSPASARLLRIMRRLTTVGALRTAIFDTAPYRAQLVSNALVALFRLPNENNSIYLKSSNDNSVVASALGGGGGLASSPQTPQSALSSASSATFTAGCWADVVDRWCSELQDLHQSAASLGLTTLPPSGGDNNNATPSLPDLNAAAVLLCARVVHLLTQCWIGEVLDNGSTSFTWRSSPSSLLSRDVQRFAFRLAQQSTDLSMMLSPSSFPIESLDEAAIGCMLIRPLESPTTTQSPSSSSTGKAHHHNHHKQQQHQAQRYDPELLQEVTNKLQNVLRMNVAARGPYGVVRQSIEATVAARSTAAASQQSASGATRSNGAGKPPTHQGGGRTASGGGGAPPPSMTAGGNNSAPTSSSSCSTIAGIVGVVFSDSVFATAAVNQNSNSSSSPLTIAMVDEILFLDVSRTVTMAATYVRLNGGGDCDTSPLGIALAAMASELFMRTLAKIQLETSGGSGVGGSAGGPSSAHPLLSTLRSAGSITGSPIDASVSFLPHGTDGGSAVSQLESGIAIGSGVAVMRALCTCSRHIRKQLSEEICDVLATKRNVMAIVLKQDNNTSNGQSGGMSRTNTTDFNNGAVPAPGTTTVGGGGRPPHQRTSSGLHHHQDDRSSTPTSHGGSSPWRVASQMFCLSLLTRIAVVDDADAIDVVPLLPTTTTTTTDNAIFSGEGGAQQEICLHVPRDLDSESLDRVLQLLCESIDDEIRDEVHRGRILQSASSIASFATPMYVGTQLEHLVHLLARIAASFERRVGAVTNFVQDEILTPINFAQNNQPRSQWRSLLGILQQQQREHRTTVFGESRAADDEDEGYNGGGNTTADAQGEELLSELVQCGSRRPRLHSTKYLLAKPCLLAISNVLASDSAALDRVTVAITQLSLTLGWPGTGTLYQNFRSGDAASLRSIGIVLQTLLLPFVTIVAHTQQIEVVAARCAGLVVQLSVLSHTEHSFEMLRRRYAHICRWWPASGVRFGADLWLMKTPPAQPVVVAGGVTWEQTSHHTKHGEHFDNADQGPIFAYALSEASLFPWQSDLSSMQVQRFRSFWLMLAMHNITSGPADTIVQTHGLAKRSNSTTTNASNNSINLNSSASDKKYRNGPWAIPPTYFSHSTGRCGAQRCHVRSSVASKGAGGGCVMEQRGKCAALSQSSIISYAHFAFHTIHVGGETGAAAAIAFPLRMLASCVPPLIHLRAAECQQALAEGISFERQIVAITGNGSTSSSSAVVDEIRRELQASLAAICPPVASLVKSAAMTFSELALLKTLFDVAILRASSSTIHTLVQYAQVELREFVSSKELLEAIPVCLDWAVKVYVAGLSRPVSSLSFSVFRCDSLFVSDAAILVQLAAIAVPSVRRMSVSTLESMFTAMPHMVAEPRILSALLHTINVVQTGDEDELSNFTANLHLRHISEASSGPYDTERHSIHDTLLKAGRRWLQNAKDVAAHRLFDSSIRFLIEDHDEHRNLLGTAHYEGTELAIRCCLATNDGGVTNSSAINNLSGNGGPSSWADVYSGLVSMKARGGALALASSRLRNYSNTMMRRSRATGAIDGAAAHATSIAVVERDHLRDLQRAIRRVLESLSESPQLSERLLVKLASCQKNASPISVLQASKPSSSSFSYHSSSHVLMIRAFDTIANIAALIEANHVSRAQLPTTLRYLVQGPVQAFLPSVLHLATGAWKWLLTCGALSSRTNDVREFVANLCLALEWTVTQRLGLFDGAPHTQRVLVETGCTEQQAMSQIKPLEPENTNMATSSSDGASPSKSYYASDYRSNSPHKILLSFLAEQFLDRRLPIAHDPVVLRMLLRTVLFWTRDAEVWSLKDASFGEYMRGILFCLHVITSVHQANQQLTHLHQKTNHNVSKLSSPGLGGGGGQTSSSGAPSSSYPCTVAPFSVLITARSRVYQCLLRWLGKTPPSYYMTQESHSAVNNELHVLEELISLVGKEQDLLSQNQRGFLPVEDPLNSNDKLEAISTPSTAAVLRRKNSTPSESPAGSGNLGLQPGRPASHAASLRGGGSGGGVPTAISDAFKKLHNTLGLVRFLLKHEALRLRLWVNPRSGGVAPTGSPATLVLSDITPELWKAYCSTAATVMPEVLIAIAHRFPTNPHVSKHTSLAVTSNPAAFAHIADAVDWYLHEGTLMAGAEHLYLWTACSIVQALRFLGPTFKIYPHVVRYAIRSLLSADSRHLIFYLPQLLQCYTNDNSQSIERFFRAMCQKSTEFTHQLLWCLQTEGEGSGVLAGKCNLLAETIRTLMTPQQFSFYLSEFQYVSSVISVSGKLKPVEKAKRKEQLRTLLQTDVRTFHEPIPKSVLYLPTNPNFRITKLIPHTAGAMQSAAKCPILVQFEVVPRDTELVVPLPLDLVTDNKKTTGSKVPAPSSSVAPTAVLKKACIFKMGDDCRQDQIALQLISYIQRILQSVNLPFFLHPYRVVTTGASSGIIECVPNAMSRDQIGKLVESNIAEHFVQTYGPPQSPAFREARLRFIQSMASYSVASFILNIKDRHNGNIMFDDKGHLIHIDFGFIFDFSPGGDMNFESSPFKLTQEMLQLMGDTVRGNQTIEASTELYNALIDPESYETFVRLTVLCYLAVRQHAKDICVLVELMLSSGLPCFKPKKTIADLADRLSLNRTEVEAAAFMFDKVLESRDNLRTRLYDRFQNIAEGIEM